MKDFIASYGLELILLICMVTLIWIGLNARKSLLKHLLFNTSAILIVFLFYEFIVTLQSIPQSTLSYSSPYYIHHPALGYGVADSSFSIQATKRWKHSEKEIYDVIYSFADGKRVTPDSDATSQQYSIFLGGSFAFGEGINDTETLPYYYNQLASPKRNIKNHGFHGYGTHQVYTMAKNQIANDTVLQAAENVEIFYWFIDPHILRANGYSPWDQKSARYIVENGDLKHTGTFKQAKDARPLVVKFLSFIWTNSGIFSRIKPRLATGKKGIGLVLRLIKEMDLLFKTQGFEFTVLVQNTSGSDPLFGRHYEEVRESVIIYLEEQGIPFIRVNEAVLKGKNDTDLLNIPGDGHPTGEFNKRLAASLWKKSNSDLDLGENSIQETKLRVCN